MTRCRELTVQVNALERELRVLVRAQAPALLAVPGCGVLGAAVIVGQTADGRLDPAISWRGPWIRYAQAAQALLGRRLHGKAVLDIE